VSGACVQQLCATLPQRTCAPPVGVMTGRGFWFSNGALAETGVDTARTVLIQLLLAATLRENEDDFDASCSAGETSLDK